MNKDIITAVICDIVDSSRYQRRDRAAVQEHVEAAWEYAVSRIAQLKGEAFGFRFTGGDEFEFTCPDVAAALESVAVMRLKCRVLKVKPRVTFRASIAMDERFVNGGSGPYSQDGPVFHRARLGMELLKKESKHLTTVCHPKPEFSPALLVNELLPLTDVIYSQWTSLQAETILLEKEGLKREAIAERMGISLSAVSQRLEKTSREDYFRAMKIFERILQEDIKVKSLKTRF